MVQDVKANQTAVKILIPSLLILIGLWFLHFVIEIRYIVMQGFRQDPPHEIIFGSPGLILPTRRECRSRPSTTGSALL
jgi:hypothetical protein